MRKNNGFLILAYVYQRKIARPQSKQEGRPLSARAERHGTGQRQTGKADELAEAAVVQVQQPAVPDEAGEGGAALSLRHHEGRYRFKAVVAVQPGPLDVKAGVGNEPDGAHGAQQRTAGREHHGLAAHAAGQRVCEPLAGRRMSASRRGLKKGGREVFGIVPGTAFGTA